MLLQEDYNHKYPYDWRTGKPTIFRSTYQWFSSVDKFKLNALDEINKVSWYPSFFKEFQIWYLKDQLVYHDKILGITHTVFYYKDSNDIFINAETINQICEIFKKRAPHHGGAEIIDFLPININYLMSLLKVLIH